MRRMARGLAAFALLLAAGMACHAQGGENPWAFSVSPRIWGLDLGAGYRGATTLWAYAGGGYEGMNYYRQSEALITGANLTGAKLLGVERGRLVNAPFSKFVAENDADPWHW